MSLVDEIAEALAENVHKCGPVTVTMTPKNQTDLLRRAHDALRWIPVEEELPKPEETVIVLGGIAYVDKDGVWFSRTGIATDRPIQWEVKHWMPLPSPPQLANNRED